ncbi:putative F-box domain-containing protein [Helianthus anomalus]
MAELALDVVEDILVRLDVEDLIRCKSVCKSWYSFISCSRFVKAHLKHAYNNDPELGGHRRIALSSILSIDHNNCVLNGTHIVGSCNGVKVIGEVKYRCIDGFNGVLCGGALHWFMSDKYKRVILSLDLSTQEFKEIPQPADEEYVNDVDDIECFLGVIEEYLCMYWDRFPLSSKTWVMKNNTWELYNNDHCETKYDVSHSLLVFPTSSQMSRYIVFLNLGIMEFNNSNFH